MVSGLLPVPPPLILGSVTVAAPAKVNLYLHVTGKRDDGLHDLESLAVFADYGDSLRLAPARDLTLKITGPFAGAAPPGPDNLVLRAAEALRQAARVRAGAEIWLDKRLPVAAGIGGGSADAAAVLAGLARLWNLPGLPGDPSCWRGLGADVPACLHGRPVLMAGAGERLTPLPFFPAFPAMLVNPGCPLSTAEVFRSFRMAAPAHPPWPSARALRSRAGALLALGGARNDLTPAAVALRPQIAEVLAELVRLDCLLARMSGSGATCFALFGSAGGARAAAAALRQRHPAWWVHAVTLRGTGRGKTVPLPVVGAPGPA